MRTCEKNEEANEYVMASISIETPLKPEDPNYVRGHLICSGWIVSARKDNPNHSDVSYVIQTNPKGYIPGFVIKNAQKSCPDSIKVLREFCKKNFK